jgi:putative DNA primase/helicase
VSEGIIPASLRNLRIWMLWKWATQADGTKFKLPLRTNGKPGSSTDPGAWSTYDEAVAALAEHPEWAGLAFALAEHVCVVDFDGCVPEASRNVEGWALDIIRRLDSYAEYSPSGTGVHVIMFGPGSMVGLKHTIGPGRRVELYSTAHYFTFTGEHLTETPIDLQPRTDAFLKLRADVEARRDASSRKVSVPRSATKAATAAKINSGTGNRTDEEILILARESRNSAQFEALMSGDLSGHKNDHSGADLALCGQLAFWTGCDAEQMDRIFRTSGLYRKKWDSRRGLGTYGEQTVQLAIENCAEVYEGSDPANDVWKERMRAKMLSKSAQKLSNSNTNRQDDGKPSATDSSDSISGNEPGPLPPEADNIANPGEPYAIDLYTFMDTEIETGPALWGSEEETLLPVGGLLLLVGKGGHGKTTLSIEAALHLAAGEAYLGYPAGRPVRILIIENEGPREQFRRKLVKKTGSMESYGEAASRNIFIRTFDWGAFTVKDSNERVKLRTFIEENAIDLVIGDPLDALGMEGVGSPENTRDFIAHLSQLGLARDVAFWLLHHPIKHIDTVEDELDYAAGAWGGKPDTMMYLSNQGGNRSRLAFPKIRWRNKALRMPAILAFDPDAESFSYVTEEKEAGEVQDGRYYLMEIKSLLSDGEWRTAQEIHNPREPKDPDMRPGIGGSLNEIRSTLTDHPNLFISEAGNLHGRHKNAIVWGTIQGGSDSGLTPGPSQT